MRRWLREARESRGCGVGWVLAATEWRVIVVSRLHLSCLVLSCVVLSSDSEDVGRPPADRRTRPPLRELGLAALPGTVPLGVGEL